MLENIRTLVKYIKLKSGKMLCSECLCPSKTYAETVTPNVAGGAFGK
jgi:hypothetical protein